jgi:hypothetical protein
MTPQQKAIKYDEIIQNINTLEKMYTEALTKYPKIQVIIKEKLTVIKLVKA